MVSRAPVPTICVINFQVEENSQLQALQIIALNDLQK